MHCLRRCAGTKEAIQLAVACLRHKCADSAHTFQPQHDAMRRSVTTPNDYMLIEVGYDRNNWRSLNASLDERAAHTSKPYTHVQAFSNKLMHLVRTRTDADTKEARSNDTVRRDAMISSGAQILSTDYPGNEPAPWPGHYAVTLPREAVPRCNPVNAPASCSAKSMK